SRCCECHRYNVVVQIWTLRLTRVVSVQLEMRHLSTQLHQMLEPRSAVMELMAK
ncbi:hypothetical protein S83_065557, partial [Arachis hypogaea]